MIGKIIFINIYMTRWIQWRCG